MRTTINQLRVELQTLQQAHGQLNDFFWGSFERSQDESNIGISYPLMCAYYNNGGDIKGNTVPINLIIVIADRVYDDFSNLTDTESDTLQVCKDIVNIMTTSRRWNRICRVTSAVPEKFIEAREDKVTGHFVRLTVTLLDNKDICTVPVFGYDFDGSFAPACAPVTVTDSDGTTIVEVDSGGMFTCTPIEPVTGQNSDDTFTFTANSGDNVPLPDIDVTTGSGVLTYPSNKDIDLSNYYEIILPTGTRVPVNTVTDPGTQTAWFNNTDNITTGTGFVERTTGFGFNARVNFMIPTMGDFRLNFKLVGSDVFAGMSFIDVSPSYTDIGFAISVSGTTYYLYESGTNITSFGGANASDTQYIERSDSSIKYYVNGVLRYTQALPSSVLFSSGYMMFDCTLQSGSKIEDILLTYLP